MTKDYILNQIQEAIISFNNSGSIAVNIVLSDYVFCLLNQTQIMGVTIRDQKWISSKVEGFMPLKDSEFMFAPEL